jgi:hypothetical protein
LKNLLLPFLFLVSFSVHAQFSVYEPFENNSNEWITRNDDTASFQVVKGALDMNIKMDGDYVNAKGANIKPDKLFRAEITASFKGGGENVPYGICWGAADLDNLHLFYITASGKFGFKTMKDAKWIDIISATSSSAISKTSPNWLRVNTIIDIDGKKKIVLCINEEAVKTFDFVVPFGNYFGAFVGGAAHISFDDFIVYQRGEVQDEFEPADLSLSLSCKLNQLHFTNPLYNWSCCVDKGCRVDLDSSVTRFWYEDNRCGDYSVLMVPFPSLGNVSFPRAVEQDFGDYMAEGDSIILVRKEPVQLISIGNEAKVYEIGEVYTSYDLKGNLYIRRYYVDHPYGNEKGFVFQFICSENSVYIPVLDGIIQQVIGSLQF